MLILGYAAVDWALNPWLRREHGFSVEPDFTQLPDLVHWGGRLLHHSPALLLCNVVLVSGVFALGAQSIYRLTRGKPRKDLPERVSVFPPSARHSTPPAA
jgi:hypothetical protein